MLTVAPDAGFDALVSIADADDYCARMGHGIWATKDADAKEVALRVATQYIQSRYTVRPEFLDPVHTNVQAACCEAALKSLSGALYADVSPQVVTGETVGPITVTYDATLRNGGQVRLALVEDLLRGLTVSGFGQIKMVRG